MRNPGLRVAEVGFEFGERYAGASKASLREGARYLSHLWRLRFGDDWLRFVRFIADRHFGPAGELAAAGPGDRGLRPAIPCLGRAGDAGLEPVEFRPDAKAGSSVARQQPQGRLTRLMAFLVMNNAALALRGPILYGLTSLLGVHYLVSNLISLVVLTIVRYALADRWIWAPRAGRSRAGRTSYSYDIHGIISVTSQVALPELAPFRTPAAHRGATIRVRLGNVSRARQAVRRSEPQHIHYNEGLGSLGFGIDRRSLGDTIEVLASPILKYSPHVLYTNVVEPILRWTFVRKGYALVHGACMAFGDDAYMVTARTDTGKTTTMLRILAEPRRPRIAGAFISDDLTLVSPEGRVLTYPKPMTISHHTVKAVNARTLTMRERLGAEGAEPGALS